MSRRGFQKIFDLCGSYRLLYKLTKQPEPMLYLLLLYAKADQQDVTKDELRQLLDGLTKELSTSDSEAGDPPVDAS